MSFLFKHQYFCNTDITYSDISYIETVICRHLGFHLVSLWLGRRIKFMVKFRNMKISKGISHCNLEIYIHFVELFILFLNNFYILSIHISISWHNFS